MIDWFDLPKLTTFTTGDYSFYETTSLRLDSLIIGNGCLNELSAIDFSRFVNVRMIDVGMISFGKVESVLISSMMIDDNWLIDLIFLNSLHSLQEGFHSMKQQVWVWKVWWYMNDWIDLPNLNTFTTGEDSFYRTRSLSLSSMMIYDWLIWSS